MMKKFDILRLKREDLKIDVPPASLPVSIIMDGKLMKENLTLTELNENEINKCIEEANIKSYKDVLLMTLDANGLVYIQPKSGSATTTQLEYNGHNKW